MKILLKYWRQVIFGILLAANLIIWIAVAGAKPKGYVEVSFLNVGQGDAILIESTNGNQVLIDSGAGISVLRELGRTMPFFDRSIDVAITTHPDRDHIGGFPEIVERYKVGVMLLPGVESDNSVDEELARRIEDLEIPNFLARKETILDFKDGSYLEILFPDRDVSGLETNTASIVAKYVFGKTCFLLTGDSPSSIEDYLVAQDAENLKCDVLKAGHHGSNTSSGQNFLSAVGPKYVIISAGKDNSYGHPHREVIERLTNFGAKILSTAEEGTIRLTSDGTSIIKKK